MDDWLPLEYQPIIEELAEAPENVRLMWRYAITLLMIDDEKAMQIGTQSENGKEFVRVRTIVGDEFEIERPAMSEETERLLLQQIREIVAEEELNEKAS